MNTPSFVSWATSPHQPRQTAIRKSAVKRKLSCSGVRGQQGVFKPFLRMETRPNAWGGLKRKYQNFTVNDWKKKVLFTDESVLKSQWNPLVEIFTSGVVYSWSGVGHLHRTDSTLTSEMYHSILQRQIHPLVCIFVKIDSYSSRIMTPNTPQT